MAGAIPALRRDTARAMLHSTNMIHVSREGAVATIALARPEAKNALRVEKGHGVTDIRF